jgi:FkbM family methyltransferase
MPKDFNSFLQECLAAVRGEEEKIAQSVNSFKEAFGARSLVLFGQTSAMGASVLEICRLYGLPVTRFCDADGGGGDFCGVSVIDPQTLKNDFADAAILVCSHSHDADSIKALASLDILPELIIPWEWSASTVKCQVRLNASRAFQRHVNMYSWVYDFFEDEVSKQTVLDRLRYNLCGTPMEINTPHEIYFEDGYISFGDKEIFADCGAHVGESSSAFLKNLKSKNGNYAHIYCFEPDKRNFKRAVENLSEHPNTTVIPKGIWNSETVLTFNERGENMADSLSSSFVNHTEKDGIKGVLLQVPVTSLDAVFLGKPDSELPTFIKMDIEGAEQEALMGAADIIRRVKPKLAISAYHKPEDMYALPRIIMRLRDDYRFALRQHVVGSADTVLYAV